MVRSISQVLVGSSIIAAASVIAPATAAAASPQAVVKTTTKLTSSPATITRNSWVTFTATVSSEDTPRRQVR